MTVDEFLNWAETQEGLYELIDGTAHKMVPQTVGHVLVKASVASAMKTAIERAGVNCEVLIGGLLVRVDAHNAYIPDVLDHDQLALDPNSIEVEPLIVVAVVAHGCAGGDSGAKLVGYFGAPSTIHYLVVDADGRCVIHHRRSDREAIETRIIRDGQIVLDPPRLAVTVADFFEDLR